MTDQGCDKRREAFRQEPGLEIQAASKQAEHYLLGCGVEEPGDNALALLQHALGLNRAELLRDAREPFPEQKRNVWEAWITRKGKGEPAQYIIGEQWFYGRPFRVSPAVLIPRPETELLVEAVLRAGDRLWPMAVAQHPVVLDVGTGSGAIAVTVAAERPGWVVYASDLSPEALAVASDNAQRQGAGVKGFVEGDLLQPFRAIGSGRWSGLAVDVLVSNPPYIPVGDLSGLQPEVRNYEPRLALDGGADGLDPYRALAEQMKGLARLPAIVGLELGLGQAREVAALLESFGYWNDISIVVDYGGIERHVVAVRTEAQR